MRHVLTVAALLLTMATTRAADTPGDIRGTSFACRGEERRCTCTGPREKDCSEMAPHCAAPIVCDGGACRCRYIPGFLGGPMRRDKPIGGAR